MFFSLKTSPTSGLSSFVTFEFESNISYIKILCWDLISPQFFLTLWFFMTNFEISIFYKMPAAAVLRLRLRSKILAATRGTVRTSHGTKWLNFSFLAKKKKSKKQKNKFPPKNNLSRWKIGFRRKKKLTWTVSTPFQIIFMGKFIE